MPYPHNSPLKDNAIRKMVTATCYVEIALAAGPEWDPRKLEEQIDDKESWEQAGRYRRLARGIVPSNHTARRLQGLLGDECDIIQWRDHPFWKLLSLQPLTHRDIELALLSVTSNVKHYIWLSPHELKHHITHRNIRIRPDIESIKKIAKYRNMDSLVTLVAYAREGRDSGMLQEYSISARYCLEIFPHVIARNPHLYLCWRPLANRLQSLIWKPKPAFIMEPTYTTTLSQLNKQIESLAESARKKGIKLPSHDILYKFK